MQDSELKFISGIFFDIELPKEWRYLKHYFRSEAQLQFLRYYYVFEGNVTHFADHTGYAVSKRWVRKLCVKFEQMTAAHKQAKEAFDFKTVAEIESGKYKKIKR